MQRRKMLSLFGLAISGVLVPFGFTRSGPDKEKSVTLAISGMT